MSGADVTAESCSASVKCSTSSLLSCRLDGLCGIDDLNAAVVKSGACICSGLTSSLFSCLLYFINVELPVILI